MRKRKLRRKERKRQRKIIIFSMCLCLVFLGISFGYAAFSTRIVMNAKGNIKEKAISVSELKTEVVTSGDGLYKDSSEEGRYVYRGINPNNYIKLGDDMYRIIAAESDNTLKVVRDKSIGKYVLDYMDGDKNRESKNKEDYCYNDYGPTYFGCNVWGSKYTILDENGANVSSMPHLTGSSNLYALPETEASLNVYLNGEWYNVLDNNVKKNIVNHIWNVGPVGYGNYSLEETVRQEQAYKWKGKIGLISVNDWVGASTNTDKCGKILSYYNSISSREQCSNINWMYLSFGSSSPWTITPVSGSIPAEWLYVNNVFDGTNTVTGLFAGCTAGGGGKVGTVPAFYLSSSIKLTGKGSKNVPYVISQ